MKSTKHDSLVVESIACLSSAIDNRRRATAISTAPSAPMAPPSVGVATPMKMVPSTRKISPSGGISTKVTRSAMRDSRPMPNRRLIIAITKAMPMPTIEDTTMSSSRGASAR